jgi:hypothetical protein
MGSLKAHQMALNLRLFLEPTPILQAGEAEAHMGYLELETPDWATALMLDARWRVRSPQIWAPDANGGWQGGVPPWPLAPDWRSVAVSVQRGDPRSPLETTRRAIYLRRAMPALHRGYRVNLEPHHAKDLNPALLGFARITLDGQVVLVFANASRERQTGYFDLSRWKNHNVRAWNQHPAAYPDCDPWPKWTDKGITTFTGNGTKHLVTVEGHEVLVLGLYRGEPMALPLARYLASDAA